MDERECGDISRRAASGRSGVPRDARDNDDLREDAMNTDGIGEAGTLTADTPETNDANTGRPSHYQRIGGGPAIRGVVDRFYGLLLEDAELRPYFEVDMPRLKRHQAALLAQVLGGPGDYVGRDLGDAHASLAIPADHYRKVVNYLTGVLYISQVPSDIIGDVGQVLASLESQIVTVGGGAAKPAGGGAAKPAGGGAAKPAGGGAAPTGGVS
jgi:hemoglobin